MAKTMFVNDFHVDPASRLAVNLSQQSNWILGGPLTWAASKIRNDTKGAASAGLMLTMSLCDKGTSEVDQEKRTIRRKAQTTGIDYRTIISCISMYIILSNLVCIGFFFRIF